MNAKDIDVSTMDVSTESQLAWSEHWSDDKQESLVQRFFSVYRKVVFARAVAYFFEKYFPAKGIFVEGGSGTAETSMRINKNDGARQLVAADIVLPVLERCHPVMDGRVCADIFRLPFAENSVDGIWNVGVLEHFTQEQIDDILSEFFRVLKPGHRVLLLIPGADSPPQKILRVLEKVINFKSKEKAEFRFHPPEISQIQSRKQGLEMLERNNFWPIHFNHGWRSLLAFKILVAAKP